MFSSLSFNRSSSQLVQRNAASKAESAQDARTKEAADPAKQPESGSVVLSDEGQERLAASRKIAASLQSFQSRANESRKDQARERLEVVKRRIEELKRLLMMFGGLGGKGLVRELRQLAGELGQAAKVLSEPFSSGGMPGQYAAAEGEAASGEHVQSGPVEVQATNAATQAEASADAAAQEQTSDDAPLQAATAGQAAEAEESETQSADPQQAAAAQRQSEAQQRREDAKSLQEAVRGLKSLLAMLKSSLRDEDNDKETQKQLKAISKLIDESEQAAQSLSMGGGLSVDVAVSIEVSV